MAESFFTPYVVRSFCLELEKDASAAEAVLEHLRRPGVLHAAQAGMGSGMGLGLAAGGAIGAAAGGKRTYDAARAQGASRLSAAGSAVGGGLHGALRGAGKGALVGAAAGAAGGVLAPAKMIRGTRAVAKGALGDTAQTVANFGQRQVHGVTGWKPGGAASSIERIGGGAADTREALGKAVTHGTSKQVRRAKGALDASEEAQRMGLTSLPGVAKSMKNNGVLPTLSAGVKEQWKSSPGWQKGLLVGLPAASVANTLRKKEPTSGPGKGEQLGASLGGTLGYGMAPLTLGASTLLGSGLERAGGFAGREVDELRGAGRRPVVPQDPIRPMASEPGDTGQHAVEHVYGTGFNGNSLGQ